MEDEEVGGIRIKFFIRNERRKETKRKERREKKGKQGKMHMAFHAWGLCDDDMVDFG